MSLSPIYPVVLVGCIVVGLFILVICCVYCESTMTKVLNARDTGLVSGLISDHRITSTGLLSRAIAQHRKSARDSRRHCQQRSTTISERNNITTGRQDRTGDSRGPRMQENHRINRNNSSGQAPTSQNETTVIISPTIVRSSSISSSRLNDLTNNYGPSGVDNMPQFPFTSGEVVTRVSGLPSYREAIMREREGLPVEWDPPPEYEEIAPQYYTKT